MNSADMNQYPTQRPPHEAEIVVPERRNERPEVASYREQVANAFVTEQAPTLETSPHINKALATMAVETRPEQAYDPMDVGDIRKVAQAVIYIRKLEISEAV